ncbi:MAG: BspA family leucine-rich repeat surface protein, partial [Bacteroidaceae bacterium]|nr:BspA family leucine-rich repeat surface protein [Bacteroidaceae bacterium]
MNKVILKSLFVLFICVISQSAVAQKPYGIFDEKTGTLTLGYGKRLPNCAKELDNDGFCVDDVTEETKKIKKIVIKKSFARYKPNNCSYCFSGLVNLKEIKGLKNLNTSETTDMNSMFERCMSLTSLDLSHFDTNNVEDMSRMFEG